LLDKFQKIKFTSIWIFIVPFIAINTCLILITKFQWVFPNQEDIIHNTIPYIDGGASISRAARPYPNWLIFKPAMFLTSFLLVKYWLYSREIIQYFKKDHKHIKPVVFFGIASAVALTMHAIFLGINFDQYEFYKLFRRVVMLLFIIFEIVAQVYLVSIFYSFKNKLLKHINHKILKLKLILVLILVVVATISVPIISLPGDSFLNLNLKFLKHALEWNYFLGIISFYLLTFFMWNSKKK